MLRKAKNPEKIKQLHNNRRYWLIIGSLAIFSIIISVFAHLYPLFPGDLQLSLLLQSIKNNVMLSAMEGISYALSGWRTPVIVLAGAISLWFTLGKLEGIFVIISGLTAFINDPLKAIIGRPRPTAEMVTLFATEPDNAFPSGHTIYTVLVFGMLTYLVATAQQKSRLKRIIISGFLLLIFLVGASRIYLGVHWLSDIIGGLLIGSVLLFGLIWLYGILKSRLSETINGK
jgi:membrane-associated phospholipid phosphatase